MNKIQDIKKFDKGNTKLTYKKIKSQRDCQSQVVVVQLRSSSDKVGMDSDLHRRLERHFPDVLSGHLCTHYLLSFKRIQYVKTNYRSISCGFCY